MSYELGLIGLGKMGMYMAQRMLSQGSINLHVHDREEERLEAIAKDGATTHSSIDALVGGLWEPRKTVWMMVPAGDASEEVFNALLERLQADDIIIDGGNAHYEDSMRRAERCKAQGIHFLDVGVSGGLHGKDEGYGMMIGGDEEPFRYALPVFEALGRKEGYARVGLSGTGHYVKMVHNAIEYGMMQAIAEGFTLLREGERPPEDLETVAHIWNHGTIISSFLMQMTEQALRQEDFNTLAACVDDTGEGRWAVHEAINSGVPFPVNSAALFARKASQGKDDFTNRMLSAMRHEFGGHQIYKRR